MSTLTGPAPSWPARPAGRAAARTARSAGAEARGSRAARPCRHAAASRSSSTLLSCLPSHRFLPVGNDPVRWRDSHAKLRRVIAFLGTGIMGAPMARNLLRAGFEVRVWNRTREKAEPLAQDGATVASSPADAAAGADFVVT